jgi:polynucleotide 5'-hydroxyl-kinase GRC3/NOL9
MMLELKKGATLLLDGPAKMQLRTGEASVLGAPVKPTEQVIVRRGKHLPFEALVDSQVELALGDSASYVMEDASAIPPSWRSSVEEILSSKQCGTVLVMGGVDAGKTGFCTYLANKAVQRKRQVALIDGDVGQSDLGPPGTISFSHIREPIIELFTQYAQDLRFVGATSPSGKVESVLHAVEALRKKAENCPMDLLVVNTDGWVEGDEAVRYKTRLAATVRPDIVVALKKGDELSPILNGLSDTKVLVLDSPSCVKKRDRETRKMLREAAYRKYMREPKSRFFPLSWVNLEGNLALNNNNGSTLKKRVESLLGKEVLHCEDQPGCVTVWLGRKIRLENGQKEQLESEFGKQVHLLCQGDEEGLVVTLENSEGTILGIGTIGSIDFNKQTITVKTSVTEPVSKITVGCIKLDQNGHEAENWLENSES